MSHAPVEHASPPLGRYLSPGALEQLKAYRYVSAPLSSWVDRKMTYFWEWAVTLLPMWLAPNAVTTFSFCHAIVAHLLIQYYSPTLVEQAPQWAYIVVACLMFLYQTLDAIDGKQARRTKSGSPLGQLFDHGCDAVTAWIMGIFIAATSQCGSTPLSYVVMMMVVVPFFAANWEESCTSVFRFGIVGVTEGQFIVMGKLLLTGIAGPDIWFKHVFSDLLGMEAPIKFLDSFLLFHVIIGTAIIGGCYQLTTSLWTVYLYYQKHRNESRRQAIVSLVQFTATVALGYVWTLAPSGAMQKHARIILCVVGALCSYQASRLIICHVTGQRFPTVFFILWPLPLVVLNEWSGAIWRNDPSELYVQQDKAAWLYAAFVFVMYVHFIYVAINQITSFLGIECFRIAHLPHHHNAPTKAVAEKQAATLVGASPPDHSKQN